MDSWFGPGPAAPPPAPPIAAAEQEEEVLLGGVIVEDEPPAPAPVAARPASVAPAPPPPRPPPPASSAPSVRVPGARKVIVHMLDGSTKRGTVRDVDLGAPTLAVESQPGVLETLPAERLKAVFFLVAAGAPAAKAEGQKVKITLTDGRSLAGVSADHASAGPGFFLVPADNRSTERIFVFRAAVKAVATG